MIHQAARNAADKVCGSRNRKPRERHIFYCAAHIAEQAHRIIRRVIFTFAAVNDKAGNGMALSVKGACKKTVSCVTA